MSLKAICFDFGGVIVRTEFQAPRQHLAERLGIEYEQLIKAVFDSETARQATLGVISEGEHWAAVMQRFRLPTSEAETFEDEFFAGDILDHALVEFIRSLRPQVRTGLISNAWSGLRDYIISQKFDDAFDAMVISAEVGVMKPEARIYQIALEKLGVAPSEAAFVDDFPENVEGARAVGMAAVHFNQPEKALKELKALLANHH
jgi:epoxide hydrolase-like predicted phosphatase